MTCETARKLLDPLLDGHLTSEEEAAVREHLDLCPSCRDELERLREVVSVVRGIPQPTAPEGFAEEVIRRLPPILVAGRVPARLFRWIAQPAGLAASLAAACLLVVLVMHVSAPADRSAEVLDVATEPRVSAETRSGPAGPLPSGGGDLAGSLPPEGIPRPASPRDVEGVGAAAVPPAENRQGSKDGVVALSGTSAAAPAPRAPEQGDDDVTYVVQDARPDATAGVLIAELNHRRALDPERERKREPCGDAGEERLVPDAKGEPERLHLLLTKPELDYVLELIRERRDSVVVARMAGLPPRSAAAEAEKPAPPGAPPPIRRMRVQLKFERGR